MKIKSYPKYKKKKNTPKAIIGAATAGIGLGKAIYGGFQARKAKKAEKAFDKSRLQKTVSSATQQMADEPIDQSYVENLQQQQAADRASAMGALSKDPRNVLAGVQALEGQAAKQRTALLGMQDKAKTAAMGNLAKAQDRVQDQNVGIAQQELAGIRGQKAAAEQNIFGGVEDVASGIGQMFPVGKDGAKIEAEEGGVTPDEFDHDTNKIDLVQDGEKIGEATGGELILPPDDVEAVRAALSEGDKDAAFKLMEDLVAKYDKNVIEAEEEEAPKEEPAPMMKHGGYLEKVKARMGAYMKSKY